MTSTPVRVTVLHTCVLDGAPVDHEAPVEVREKVHDLRGREVLAIAPLLVVIIVLGFYPKPVLDIINPAVDRVMQAVDAQDPAPAVAPVAEGTTK